MEEMIAKDALEILGLQLFAEHRAWMRKFPISDRFYKFHCSSLNTCPICIILSAFECCEYSQDNTHFKMQKCYFLILVGLIRSILEDEYGQIIDCMALGHMVLFIWVVMHVYNVYKYNRTTF